MVPIRCLRKILDLRRRPTSVAKAFRSRFFPAIDRHVDLIASLALVALTLVAVWDLVIGGTVVGKDTATQFYPWYSYLGESLRSGRIPAWKPEPVLGSAFRRRPPLGMDLSTGDAAVHRPADRRGRQ